MLKVVKVGLALKVAWLRQWVKWSHRRALGWGVALKGKGLCLLFAHFFSVDCQEPQPGISPRSSDLDAELAESLSFWPGMIPRLAESTLSVAHIKVWDRRSLPHCGVWLLGSHRDLLGNRISESPHFWGPISAVGARRARKSHQSCTMTCVLPSPTTILPLRTYTWVLLYLLI